MDTKEDKNKLIDDYKTALSTKDCKYFDKGVGKCPFGNKCFYRHAFPDGRVCDVGPPPRQRRATRGFDNAAIEVLQVFVRICVVFYLTNICSKLSCGTSWMRERIRGSL